MTMEKEKLPVNFAMKMPHWFMNLNGEEKVRVVENLAKLSPTASVMTEEELLDLMPMPGE